MCLSRCCSGLVSMFQFSAPSIQNTRAEAQAFWLCLRRWQLTGIHSNDPPQTDQVFAGAEVCA